MLRAGTLRMAWLARNIHTARLSANIKTLSLNIR